MGAGVPRRVVAFHHPPPHRDGSGRRRRAIRNHLLGTWMRRPARRAVDVTAQAVVSARRDPEVRRGVLDALGSLPGALRQRRVIDPDLDRRLQMLEMAGRTPSSCKRRLRVTSNRKKSPSRLVT